MPQFPIVDAHVHLWDPARFRMAWLDGDATLERAYGLEDYAAHTAGQPVEAIVYVEVGLEAADALAEAEAVAALATTQSLIQGIVAAAALEHGPAVREHLAALAALGPKIKGVRRLLQGEPDPAFCLRPEFVAGVQLLPEWGFSFDICVVHPQLASVTELVRRCPDVSFVLDHIGKPDIRGGNLDPWRDEIAALAALPNVVCKLSGLVTEADHAGWTADDLRPYVAHVIEQFGVERVLFGGDWPVCLLAASWARWVSTLQELTADLPEAAQRQLWAENARRVYRLSPAR